MKYGLMDIKGELNAGVWHEVEKVTVAVATNTISFIGLNGDKDGEYMLIVDSVNDYAGSVTYGMTFNADTGANYGFQNVSGINTTAAALRGTAQSSILFGTADATYKYNLAQLNISARSGVVRLVDTQEAHKISATQVSEVYKTGAVWNNTADNLTSITLTASQATGFGVGTTAYLLRKTTELDGMKHGDIDVWGELNAGCFQSVKDIQVVDADAYTTLLLHFNGFDGETIVDDSSPSAHVVTANGNFKIDDRVGFVGNLTSGYFDGSGDYLTIPDSSDFAFGSGDFTIEGAFVRGAFGTTQFILAQGDNSGTDTSISYVIYLDSSNFLTVWWYESPNLGVGSRHTLVSSVAIEDNGKHHFAFVRNGNTLTLYQDGVPVDTDDVTGLVNYDSTYTFTIGRFGDDPIYYFNGWISEVRISKGIARYTAPFTPPTTPHAGNVSHKLDVIGDVDTVLLLPGDGADGSTAIKDDSNFQQAITVNGTVAIDTAQSVFGGSSIYFDNADSAGGANYLSLAASNYNTFVSDFTVSGWFRPEYLIAGRFYVLYSTITGGTPQLRLGYDVDTATWQAMVGSVSAFLFAGGSLSVGTWSYIKLTRIDGVLKLLVDGSQIGVDESAPNICGTDGGLYIGRDWSGTGAQHRPFRGWIEDFYMSREGDDSTIVPTRAKTVFKAIDGDACGLICGNVMSVAGVNTATFGVCAGLDNGSNYNNQSIVANNATLSAARASAAYARNGYVATAGGQTWGAFLMSTVSGHPRYALNEMAADTVTHESLPFVWSNTTKQLRVLSFWSNVARGFDAGSVIDVGVYRPKP